MTDFTAARIAMVDCQIRPADVTQYPIIAAFLAVPREEFVPNARRATAYIGDHLPLGGGRVLLDPRALAKMLELLSVGPEDLVLDIGAAHGYSTALIARLAQAVVGVEELSDMAAEASRNLNAQSVDNAMLHEGPLVAGNAALGPYDAIIIEGGIGEVPPALTAQLKEGGRMVAIFMRGALGQARLGRMIGGKLSWRNAFDAAAPMLPGFEAAKAFEF